MSGILKARPFVKSGLSWFFDSLPICIIIKSFEHEVSQFLNQFLSENLHTFDEEQYRSDFEGMLSFVHDNFEFGFAKSKNATTTPRSARLLFRLA